MKLNIFNLIFQIFFNNLNQCGSGASRKKPRILDLFECWDSMIKKCEIVSPLQYSVDFHDYLIHDILRKIPSLNELYLFFFLVVHFHRNHILYSKEHIFRPIISFNIFFHKNGALIVIMKINYMFSYQMNQSFKIKFNKIKQKHIQEILLSAIERNIQQNKSHVIQLTK